MKINDLKLAVLITCHNRRKTTIKCLQQLFEIKSDLDVFVVDDLSTDGTFEEIKSLFPQVYLFQGTGNLFWNRGMHASWEMASKYDFDYYLWLNDDVFLYNNFIKELLECGEISGSNSIVTGLLESYDKKEVTYGGYTKSKTIIRPNGKLQDVTFLNGNVVFIPKTVFNILGNLDPYFHHDLGDVDYGLRAIKRNINVVTTRSIIGSCDNNSFSRVRLNNVSLKKRFKKLFSPLGSNPNISFYFHRNHYGYLKAFGFYGFVIVINILPDFLVNKIFGSKYN